MNYKSIFESPSILLLQVLLFSSVFLCDLTCGKDVQKEVKNLGE